MLSHDIARKIVADHHAAPKPLAGAWDKDADLVRRISAALEQQEADAESAAAEIEALYSKVEYERERNDKLCSDTARLKAAIAAYADTLDSETFGAGLALPADLHAVAEKLREITAS